MRPGDKVRTPLGNLATVTGFTGMSGWDYGRKRPFQMVKVRLADGRVREFMSYELEELRDPFTEDAES